MVRPCSTTSFPLPETSEPKNCESAFSTRSPWPVIVELLTDKGASCRQTTCTEIVEPQITAIGSAETMLRTEVCPTLCVIVVAPGALIRTSSSGPGSTSPDQLSGLCH